MVSRIDPIEMARVRLAFRLSDDLDCVPWFADDACANQRLLLLRTWTRHALMMKAIGGTR